MKRFLWLACCCLVPLGVSGCGSSPDSAIKDQIKSMNDLADAVEKNEPDAKIQDLQKRVEESGKKLEALKLSEEDQKKLFEKHKDELSKAMGRYMAAMMKKGMKDLGGAFPGMPKTGK